MKKKILVIEPHSDDGIIGAGGYFLKFKKDFDFYFCLITASTLNLNHGKVTKDTRIQEYEKYVDFFSGKFMRSYKENKEYLPLDEESKLDLFGKARLINIIENVISEVNPDVLMVTGPSFHQDHQLVYESTIAATRPTRALSVKETLIMENPTYVHSPYQNFFKPNLYVELDENLIDQKCKVFEDLFPSQYRKTGNYLSKDGIKNHAAYRGIEARAKYAEAFYQFTKKI